MAVPKIKLDLFKLKPKHNLTLVHEFFKSIVNKWFDENGNPKNNLFKIISCPLCSSNNATEKYFIDGFRYNLCKICESIYVNPCPNLEVIESLYRDGIYDVYQDKLVRNSSGIRNNILDLRKISQIEKIVFKTKSKCILDVGCGSGSFLSNCASRGWSITGLDPSNESSIIAKNKYKIDIAVLDFDSYEPQKKFDVITFWGVLEHMTDPIGAITKAYQLLNKNGILVFEVPSADCFMSHYIEKYNFSPTRYIESARHNIFFSKKIIEQYAADTGFIIELLESNGLDLQTILLEEFNPKITDIILNMQDILNDLLLGDHYRVFLRKT